MDRPRFLRNRAVRLSMERSSGDLPFQQIHDVVSREHSMGPLHEGFQQVELAGGEGREPHHFLG